MTIKKLLLSPFILLDRILDRVIAVLGAVIFAQFPQFISQYIQRMGGHVDELTRIISQYKKAAEVSGKTLESYIQFHLTATIPDYVNSGKIMEANVERYNDLKSALNDLVSSTGYTKFFIFVKEIDSNIFKAAMDNFSPGIPTSIEGAVYAGCGLIMGWLLYAGIKKLIQLPFKKKKAAAPPAGARKNDYYGTGY